jgi:hypothetical protein
MVRPAVRSCARLALLALLGVHAVSSALPAASLAHATPGAVAAAAPSAVVTPEVARRQVVGDPRGDQVVTGSVPAAARRSGDVRQLVVRRDARQIHLTLRVSDVRSSADFTQTFAVELRHPRLQVQRFTTTGGTVTKTTSGENTRGCGSATRDPRQDVMTMRLPFRCLRSVPGALLDLRAELAVTGDRGSTLDRTRTVKADVR